MDAVKLKNWYDLTNHSADEAYHPRNCRPGRCQATGGGTRNAHIEQKDAPALLFLVLLVLEHFTTEKKAAMVKNPVGNQVVLVSVALGVIDAIAAALRMLARWKSNSAFGADDALIIASLIPSSAMVVISYLSQSKCYYTPSSLTD